MELLVTTKQLELLNQLTTDGISLSYKVDKFLSDQY